MKIIFYHSCDNCKKTREMQEKLYSIGCYKDKEDDDRTWTWPGLLQEFVPKWNDKFMAAKNENEWVIYVTQKGTFGQYG